jgi:amidase
MPAMDLTSLTATEIAALVRKREASALDVVEAHLARIARLNPKLNAIVTLDADGARARAREADATMAKGGPRGPLHGVPFTLKDMHAAAGMQTSMGTRLTARVADRDGVVAERLKGAGAILLGKTNMAISVQTNSELYGLTCNPYDLGRASGGSSGGAAAAVAARLVPFDVGTDMSGSIRMPCHFCGVFGLKPTTHRIPSAPFLGPPGVPRIDRDLGVSGPIARSAADLALLFRVLAGPDPRDYEVAPVPVAEVAEREPASLRIAFAPTIEGIACGRGMREVLERAAARLAEAGARVEARALPFTFQDLLASFRKLIPISLSVLAKFGLAPPAAVAGAKVAEPSDLAVALDERDAFAAKLEAFLEGYDAWMCPSSITTAFPHCPPGSPIDVDGVAVPSLCVDHASIITTFTGSPSLVVPVGLDTLGLPVGAQLVGRRWRDEDLVAVGGAVARVVGPLPAPALD